MVPSNALSTMRATIHGLCRSHGFDPLFVPVEAPTQQEYLEAGLPNGIYIYPATVMDSPLITADESRTTVRFTDPTPAVHGFAVSLLDPRGNLFTAYDSPDHAFPVARGSSTGSE